MADFSIAKVVSALPGTLVAERLYFVRVGDGVDVHVTDSTAQAKGLNLPTAASLGTLVDRTGAPYTVLAEDIGRTVLVDDTVTLPVLAAASALGRIDIVSAAPADLTPALAPGVAPLIGAQAIEPAAAASLILRASDGSAATWHMIGGRA